MSLLWVYPAVAAVVLLVVLTVKVTTRGPRVARPGGGRRTARTAAAFTVGAVVTGAAMTLGGFAGSTRRR